MLDRVFLWTNGLIVTVCAQGVRALPTCVRRAKPARHRDTAMQVPEALEQPYPVQALWAGGSQVAAAATCPRPESVSSRHETETVTVSVS